MSVWMVRGIFITSHCRLDGGGDGWLGRMEGRADHIDAKRERKRRYPHGTLSAIVVACSVGTSIVV